MKKESKKFLEFNGKSIHFLAADGEYWIALKPICEVLEVDFIRQLTDIKDNEFLSEYLSEQELVAPDGKLQKMICLPESMIYGWLFLLESDAPGLIDFKRDCFTVLNNNPSTQVISTKIY
ncbi:MAG: phage antirepressor N-terminal domain-containing protein [Bacteroidota bacterium]|nr:phage antirepressor N-terminal domain-containing protein [Bacteroidota bacterium]